LDPSSARISRNTHKNMTDTDITGAKLRLRRDAIYMKTEKGIIFRRSGRSFSITGTGVYRAFRQLVPFLDGNVSVDEILGSARESGRPALQRLLQGLVRANVVVKVDEADAASIDAAISTTFAAQIDFIQHYATQPHGRFMTFREQRVMLVGGGVSAVAAASALLRNGLRRICLSLDQSCDLEPVKREIERLALSGMENEMFVVAPEDVSMTEFDLLVYCADEPDLAHVSRLNLEALQKRWRFLPAYFHEHKGLIGPLVTPGQPGCWNCALLRWTDNAPVSASAAVWESLAGARIMRRTAQAVSELSAQIQGNNLALEIFKLCVDIPERETQFRVLAQDVSSLESVVETLLPHPECVPCAQTRVRLTQRAQTVTGNPASTPLQKWEPYLSGRLAVFNGFLDDSIEQLPLRISVLALKDSSRKGETDASFGVAGWSLDSSEASRTNALKAGLCHEWFEFFPTKLHILSQADLPNTPTVITPRRIVGWLGSHSSPRSNERFLQVMRCRDGMTAWVPADSIHPALGSNGRFDSHRWGLGCGINDEAIEAARLSAYEYQVIADMAARTMPAIPVVDLNSIANENLRYLLHSVERLGMPTPRAGVALLGRDIAVTVLCDDAAAHHGRNGILLGSGSTLIQALVTMIGQYVTNAQVARQKINLQTPGWFGLYARAQLEVKLDTRTVLTSAGPGLDPMLPGGDYEPWWIDVTGSDMELTESMRVVKVILVSRNDRLDS
jgi:bacteriocin biosynthesis cyclodehydratase domain-containing protein